MFMSGKKCKKTNSWERNFPKAKKHATENANFLGKDFSNAKRMLVFGKGFSPGKKNNAKENAYFLGKDFPHAKKCKHMLIFKGPKVAQK